MPSEGSTIEHGMLVRQWKWPLRVVFWWLMIAGCVTIYAASAQAWWAWRRAPEAMLAHASQVLAADLATLQALDAVLFEPAEIADWIFRTIHDNVISATVGIPRERPAASRHNSRGSESRTAPADTSTRRCGTGEVSTDRDATRIFAVRTAICTTAAPLALAVGAADGSWRVRVERPAPAASRRACTTAPSSASASLPAGLLLVLGLPQFAGTVLMPRSCSWGGC
jgi:hypothetical protein